MAAVFSNVAACGLVDWGKGNLKRAGEGPIGRSRGARQNR